jgi:hypothetical protein
MRTYGTADRGYVRDANGVAPSPWLIVRTIFALGAAAAFAVASFSDWFGGIVGTDLGIRAFWRIDPGVASSLFQSAAIVTLALAVLTLLAMATVSGGLLRLTGALGLIAAFLIGVEMQRAGMNILDTAQVGLWLIVAGGALALIAGFVPATRVVARTTPATGEAVNVDRDRTVTADDDDTVHVHDDPNVRTS